MEWGPLSRIGYASMHLQNSRMLIELRFNENNPNHCSVTCKKISYSQTFFASSFEEAKKIAEKLVVQAIKKYQQKLLLVIDEIENSH